MDREPQIKSLDEWLAEKRLALPGRLSPEEALGEMCQGAKLIDTRTLEQRQADGIIPGALEIGLNILPWRCHPQSTHRHTEIDPDDFDQRLIILCNQGYSSSIAAHSLQELGLTNVTDVDGGFEAWRASGLPWLPYPEEG